MQTFNIAEHPELLPFVKAAAKQVTLDPDGFEDRLELLEYDDEQLAEWKWAAQQLLAGKVSRKAIGCIMEFGWALISIY